MMDTLIKQLLNSSRVDEWMIEHGLGWLVSERMVETVSIVIGAVIVYYFGRMFITDKRKFGYCAQQVSGVSL